MYIPTISGEWQDLLEGVLKGLNELINRFQNHISIALQRLPGVHIMEMGKLIIRTSVLARQKEYKGQHLP